MSEERALSRFSDGARILVAEDEYLVASDLSRALRAAGADVIGPVPTLKRAREAIARSEVTGAVLDVDLRGDTVFPLADALAEDGVPFIFMTGYGSQALPERFQDVPCCYKPHRTQLAVDLLIEHMKGRTG